MTALDARRAALVLLDCEEGVASRVLTDPDARKTYADTLRRLIGAAKRAGVPVVRVDVEFRPGHVEVASSNAYFSAAKAAGRLVERTDQTLPMRELADLVADTPRVVKRRIGAMAGTDLEWVLRGAGRNQLWLAGLITRGAVLSTACHAADLDYEVVVVADACGEMDAGVHKVLLEAVLPLRASVVSVADLAGSLAG
jgi:nicotinamidase-related amidase